MLKTTNGDKWQRLMLLQEVMHEQRRKKLLRKASQEQQQKKKANGDGGWTFVRRDNKKRPSKMKIFEGKKKITVSPPPC